MSSIDMENYLKAYHSEDITNLLNDNNNNVHVSIHVNFTVLRSTSYDLFKALLCGTFEECQKWDKALLAAQTALIERNQFLDSDYQIKENCHVRFINFPNDNHGNDKKQAAFPTNAQVGQFVQVAGNVVRMTQARLLEIKREYICSNCKKSIFTNANYTKMFTIEPPKCCPNQCKGSPYQKDVQPHPGHCIDYQEIKIQENTTEKNIPSSLIVTLDNDLVHSCQPGDFVTICGTLNLRWNYLIPGKVPEIVLTMHAVSVVREEKRVFINKDIPEQLVCLRAEWQDSVERYGELGIRDIILQSICPDVHGMYVAKLAVALVMCSNVAPRKLGAGSTLRGNSHLLFIGDPGLAKSRIIKFASSVVIRSVHTTGMGCSAAGLTAAVIKEDGEWQLEAGALVLADSGICCIDEFNLMRESDKENIHEAMEQQTISIAKAGLVCKLSTRCAILAATNPKNSRKCKEINGATVMNSGIAPPLLSRFDIVLLLRDEHDTNWDSCVIDHVLKRSTFDIAHTNLWDLEKLRNHFLAIRDVDPEMSSEANTILSTYYQICRKNEMRDTSRTTTRFFDSLIRLACAHARLLFRHRVTCLDAVVIVQLMESSWGFGNVLPPMDILRKDLPMGPSIDEIKYVLDKLNLSHLINTSSPPNNHSNNNVQVGPKISKLRQEKENISENHSSHNRKVVPENYISSSNTSPCSNHSKHESKSNKRKSFLATQNEPIDNFDEIFSLDNIDDIIIAPANKNQTTKNEINGNQLQRTSVKLSKFEFRKPKMQESNGNTNESINTNMNASTSNQNLQTSAANHKQIEHVQGRCDSDPTTISKQNRNPNDILESTECRIPIDNLENGKTCENKNNSDSAYDTFAFGNRSNNTTNNISSSQRSSSWILSSQNKDLSCMDDLNI